MNTKVFLKQYLKNCQKNQTVGLCRVQLFLLVFASFFISTKAHAQDWDSTMYAKFDYKSIVKFKPVNEHINPEKVDIPLLNAVIFYETNRQRVLHKRTPFKHSVLLEKTAQGHSDDMNQYDFFSHTSVVKGKKELSDRFNIVGIKWRSCAENISNCYMLALDGYFYSPSQTGGGFETTSGKPIKPFTYLEMAKEIVKGWMESKGHRENILNESLDYLGVGNSVYFVGEGIDKVPYVYSTQNFCTF